MGESRQELLAWLNDLLQLQPPIAKIELCGSGAHYCQIIDAVYGDVPLHKVKFDSKQEFEYINNFKVLQESFTKHQVDKGIPVERLVKCKLQDNLEFCQWIHKFYDQHCSGEPYDALARRKQKAGPAAPAPAATNGGGGGGGGVAAAPKKILPAKPAPVRAQPAAARPAPSSSTTTATRPAAAVTTAASRTATTSAAARSSSESQTKITELEHQNTELKLLVSSLEGERDFYFKKLRDIEIFIQDKEGELKNGEELDPQLKQIQKILYTTDDGFEIPHDNPEQSEENQPEEF